MFGLFLGGISPMLGFQNVWPREFVFSNVLATLLGTLEGKDLAYNALPKKTKSIDSHSLPDVARLSLETAAFGSRQAFRRKPQIGVSPSGLFPWGSPMSPF